MNYASLKYRILKSEEFKKTIIYKRKRYNKAFDDLSI